MRITALPSYSSMSQGHQIEPNPARQGQASLFHDLTPSNPESFRMSELDSVTLRSEQENFIVSKHTSSEIMSLAFEALT